MLILDVLDAKMVLSGWCSMDEHEEITFCFTFSFSTTAYVIGQLAWKK